MALEIRKTCDTCGGDGVVSISSNPPQEVECWQCGGEGEHAYLSLKTKSLEDTLAEINTKLDTLLGA